MIFFITQSNIKGALSASAGTYFIIEDDLCLTSEHVSISDGTAYVSFPSDCVFDFRGGSLHANFPKQVVVKLNNGYIQSPEYCIFDKSVDIQGFRNSFIKAEWFNDSPGNNSDETFINRALATANGTPVRLENRLYELSGTIRFPKLPASVRQTLISPGTLHVNGNFAAIEVNTHSICINANVISGNVNLSNNDAKYTGTGILLSGDSYHIDVDVSVMHTLNKGFDISPVNTAEKAIVGIQYGKFGFNKINADYCMYVDIFSGKNYGNGAIWFSESMISGGVMSGSNGIYFVDQEGVDRMDQRGMNGLVFNYICFKDLTGIPVRLRALQASRFHNLTFIDSLPNLNGNEIAPWLDIAAVDDIEITVNNGFCPARINCKQAIKSNLAKHVSIGCNVIDEIGTPIKNIDKIYLMPTGLFSSEIANNTETTEIVCVSSVMPSNFDVHLRATKPANGGVYQDTIFYLKDFIPVQTDGLEMVTKVLSRTIDATIFDDNNLILDLTGIEKYAPCIIDVLTMATQGSKITFRTAGESSGLISPGYKSEPCEEIEFGGYRALYRLTWNSESQIVITQMFEE